MLAGCRRLSQPTFVARMMADLRYLATTISTHGVQPCRFVIRLSLFERPLYESTDQSSVSFRSLVINRAERFRVV